MDTEQSTTPPEVVKPDHVPAEGDFDKGKVKPKTRRRWGWELEFRNTTKPEVKKKDRTGNEFFKDGKYVPHIGKKQQLKPNKP